MGPCVRFLHLVYLFTKLLKLFSAADYNCRLPVNTSLAKIFILTFLGVLLPVIFMVTLGALLMTVPAYLAAHKTGDAAGVLMTGANGHHSLNFVVTLVVKYSSHGVVLEISS